MSSSALAAGLHQLRCKLAAHQPNDESDEHLLHAFTSRRDDSAYAVLVRRHGPMVLRVCRRVLGHEQDAEDTFQATFLVLASNAAALRNKTSLASFLHGTAYRIAMKAKQSAGRRRKHEGSLGARTQRCSPAEPVDEMSWREVRALLDEEIGRLPEIYRSVFILCCLEELSLAEAAQRSGVKPGTVSSRLTTARKRLAKNLSRRGVELSAVLAAMGLAAQSAPALPAGLIATTIKAALATAAGERLAAVVSASVAELVKSATKAMMLSKAKITSLLLLSATLLSGTGVWTCRILATPQPTEPPAQPSVPARHEGPHEKGDKITVSGRVVGPNGKPVGGTLLYLPLLKGEHSRPLATSDAEGRFRFQVQPADVRLSRNLNEPWRYAYVVAVADGYGPGIAAVGDPTQADQLTLRLAKDDVAIKGRVLDLQGKPVAGSTVQVEGISVTKNGDLTAFLEDLKNRIDGYPAENNLLTTVRFNRFCSPVTTGADGRFQMKGIGGERVARLTISGQTIATRHVSVRTRPGETMNKLAWAGNPDGDRLVYYGAEFEHVAAPTKPIVGVVRDKETGKPLANATIRSIKLAGSNLSGVGFIRTLTDKDGRYRLLGMPKGEGNVIVVEPPQGAAYLGRIHSVEDTTGLDPVLVDFELHRGVMVQGRVIDKRTGAGLDAQINYFIFDDNPAHEQFRDIHSLYLYLNTEADGSFRMVVPPGHAVIAARVLGDQHLVGVGAEKIKKWKQSELEFLPTEPLCMPTGYHRLLEINPSKDVQTLTCTMEADPGRRLNGTIVGPDGMPLAGALICGSRSYSGSYWSPEPLRAADFTIYALAPDETRNLLVIHEEKHLAGSLVVRGEEKGPVTIKLQPWGTLTGRLVTPAGNPFIKGELRFAGGLRKDDVTVGSHPQTILPRDKAGRFRVEGLVPGLNYQLTLLRGGYVGKQVTVAAGETKDLGDVIVNLNE